MATSKTTQITIRPINMQRIAFDVRGTAPLMQARFAAKAMLAMQAKMMAGSTARKGKNREARDFDRDFIEAQHISSEGWVGVPAAAFRSAAIRACKVCGFEMSMARMSIFIEQDGLDKVDGSPLVRLIAGDPEKSTMPVRNATGVVDIRVRPMWREWGLNLRVTYDADQFTASDVANLIERAGHQVGIGEGRPFSKNSNGIGFGTFTITGGANV